MIFKVAWRNIWRSKVRSFIVIGSIAVGIWAGLLIIGFSFGMNNERTASAIGTTIGHAQIHSTAFDVEPLSGAVLGDDVAVDELREEVERHALAWFRSGAGEGDGDEIAPRVRISTADAP